MNIGSSLLSFFKRSSKKAVSTEVEGSIAYTQSQGEKIILLLSLL